MGLAAIEHLQMLAGELLPCDVAEFRPVILARLKMVSPPPDVAADLIVRELLFELARDSATLPLDSCTVGRVRVFGHNRSPDTGPARRARRSTSRVDCTRS
jgi:hypothetical protein